MDVHPLDATSAVPPYEQLRVQIATRAASGDLPAGTRLPTVRALAADLHLAVNTVARAYRELETDGVISTEGRRGTFVAATPASGSTDATDAATTYAATARRLGLTLPEAVRLVEQSWTPDLARAVEEDDVLFRNPAANPPPVVGLRGRARWLRKARSACLETPAARSPSLSSACGWRVATDRLTTGRGARVVAVASRPAGPRPVVEEGAQRLSRNPRTRPAYVSSACGWVALS